MPNKTNMLDASILIVDDCGQMEGLSQVEAGGYVPVVAKGVETSAQQAFFAALGCAAFQGQHLGAVAQPEQMLNFLYEK